MPSLTYRLRGIAPRAQCEALLPVSDRSFETPNVFDPVLAEIRFGCGRAPQIEAPQSVEQMMTRLRGSDEAARAYPIGRFDSLIARNTVFRQMRSQERGLSRDLADLDAEDPARGAMTRDLEALHLRITKHIRKGRRREMRDFGHEIQRRITTRDGLRERLTAFWADHFTAHSKNQQLRPADAAYVEEAIRPHVAGRFADMLRAAATHPVMLLYLDQAGSIGPNSRSAKTGPKRGGMNENLAREMLELHTLGVDGPYQQSDVRQLAELLTGLSYAPAKGFVFRTGHAEPGYETVMGKRYGGGKPVIEDIYAAFDDLSAHPATARHIAEKLARHFVSDLPDAGLVAALETAFVDSGGNLATVTEALLRHPAAWGPDHGKVKQPFDFVTSALRALGADLRHIPVKHRQRMRRYLHTPLAQMGQNWHRPPGPDGWPEEDAAWIVPQRLVARMQWAMTVPFALMKLLPDPEDFMHMALGNRVTPDLAFAARGAETRAIGVGLVLLSPAFQRM